MTKIRLGDVAVKIGSGATPKGGAAVYRDHGVALIRSQNVLDNTMAEDGLVYISDDSAKTLDSVTVENGDILLNITGESVARVTMVDSSYLPARVNQHVMIIRPNKSVDSRYLQCVLVEPRMKSHLHSLAVGATRKALTKNMIREIIIELPSLDEQRAVAEVLGALDDKIAVNQQIHELTGELVKNLFCQFAAGRKDVTLDRMAKMNQVKVMPNEGSFRYIDIASVSEGDYSSPRVMEWNDAPGRARRGVRRGDTIWSTVRPNRRSHALVLEDDPCLVCSTGLVTLSPLGRGFSFVYEASHAWRFTEYLLSVAEGSAYPAVTASKFAHAPVPKATESEIAQFNAQCDPLWERAASAKAESRTLASLRDTLLPALMNGTLRVKDAEKQVSEVL
ncbi:type I restriction modification DNA specificity domain protein [Propionibacterium acidifaciens F0233]|uniref:Type I restriction modification DNA specificity domain protein n=1 Tax=Propionibacterium acidifaciens F0233 TaxID=553198 RepID=U2Q665_9ACTN|nr:restriction endonuclease subunit S [Propionibacterium acidifaciens]AYW78397.1 restriction endonuclease subunit S [Propionibacterium acidifaciens]ERK51866.1 type I restriction modification DNA specificity domain protein [Propionibacterium acidifaciens F0233]